MGFVKSWSQDLKTLAWDELESRLRAVHRLWGIATCRHEGSCAGSWVRGRKRTMML